MEILNQAKEVMQLFQVNTGAPGCDILLQTFNLLKWTLVGCASALIFMIAMEVRKLRVKKQQ